MSTLRPGSRIGHYQVQDLLGAGGMGAVYRARDTKLGRDVAMKVLPDEFAHDGDRLSRFQREARVLASLNHPLIGQIYGLEEFEHTPCLVLELVEGPTLADRLNRGPVPVREALDISRQIAEAIQAAHERGVIHRDLKPANIKQTTQGVIKVLDFGLAKVFDNTPSEQSLSQSPTRLSGATQPHTLLGTLPYMAPEQLRGVAADERSDIWAFGCVLYELLTGKTAFARATSADTISAVTEHDPDWTLLPGDVSLAVRAVLRRCLRKDRARRMHHIADARIEIEEAILDHTRPEASAATARVAARSRWVPGIVAGVVIGAAIGLTGFYYQTSRMNQVRMRVEVGTPGPTNASVALSPDGRSIIFDQSPQGKSQLWIRPLDSAMAHALPGTELAIFPFWSTDNRSAGFFADGKLKRIEISGGPPQVIADAPNPRGGTWNSEGTIVFNADSAGPLVRVSLNNPNPVPVTRLEKGQGSHRYPQFLPDGRHFIYLALGTPDVSGVYVGSLDSLDSKRLLSSDSQAVYAYPDLLLFLRQGVLLGQHFDLKKLELVGNPIPEAERVGTAFTGQMTLSADSNGTIAYRSTAGSGSRMTWLDRSGNEQRSFGPTGNWTTVTLSMDETRVATQRLENGNVDVWVVETSRGAATRLTTDPADDEWPVWSPDDKRIVFDSNRKGSFDLYQLSVAEIGTESPILESTQTKTANSWSSDGRYLLFQAQGEKTGADLFALPLFGNAKPLPIAVRSFDQYSASFSPDSRWLAFESNESGQNEVYVQPFPTGEKIQVSLAGGGDVSWRRDGKEIFFLATDGTLMAAAVSIPSGAGPIHFAKPVPLFPTHYLTIGRGKAHGYAITRDGQRVLMPIPVDKTPPSITLLLNWTK
jgi:serine/threonine protein kinase